MISLLLTELYCAVTVMLHVLPGGKLKKDADVLELVVVVTTGDNSELLQSNVQALVGIYPVGGY